MSCSRTATASGTISNGAQSNTIQSQVGGPIFGDGGGAQAVLATLPLAEGYTTLYRTFNLQKQKAQILRMRVVGSEAVTVPAGTCLAWKAEVASAEGEPAGSRSGWPATPVRWCRSRHRSCRSRERP